MEISSAECAPQAFPHYTVASFSSRSVEISKCAQPTPHFLFLLRDGVELPPASREAMIQVNAQLGEKTVIVAYVVSRNEPWKILNGGYYRSPLTYLWQPVRLTLLEHSKSVEATYTTPMYPPLGAVLVKCDIADRIGGLDRRFATHLGDVDWCLRARKAGITLVLASDVCAYADSATYTDGFENLYLVTRDTLLLARKHSPFWPLFLLRLVLRLVVESWLVEPPLIFSAAANIALPKRALWMLVDYLRAVRKKVTSPESHATLAAVKDFLLGRYDRLA